MGSGVVVSMRMTGQKEALAKLQELDVKGRRRVVTKAVRAANKVLMAGARGLAPTLSGALRDSLYSSIKYYSKTGSVVGRVSLGKLTAAKAKKRGTGREIPYWQFVVRGTPPHDIPQGFKSFQARYSQNAPSKSEGQFWEDVRGKRAIAIAGKPLAGVLHPGARPRPFMLIAIAKVRQHAVDDFQQAFADKMDEEVRKKT
jgi:HK97 gp10 family phage protein